MHKILWDFEIHIDHLIPARSPGIDITNKKKNCRTVDFAVPADHRGKMNKGKRETNTQTLPENLDSCGHKGDSNTICIWRAWNGLQRLGKSALRVRNQRKN